MHEGQGQILQKCCGLARVNAPTSVVSKAKRIKMAGGDSSLKQRFMVCIQRLIKKRPLATWINGLFGFGGRRYNRKCS
jgi:hypothetical protein